ncbi:MAG: homoserine kinase [Actinobacteria bacterium]|nr:homoserine kinase [Actinomycetota bacterium]
MTGTWPGQPVTVVVPATSANLGPGFDSLGLALGLHDTVQARITESGDRVQVTGVGAGEPWEAEGNLVIRAMRTAFEATGEQPPGIAISCRNEVPQGFGLGSSAAAIVAGLLAARALAASRARAAQPASVLSDAEVLSLACDIEGHPDNVAPCLSGGLTIAWNGAAGPHVARLEPMPGLTPVACVPAIPMATTDARKALPEQVPHADAVANSARSALLIAALTGRPELLLAGTEDFLHQQYRIAAMPGSAALMAMLRDAEIPAVISGAGPAVLALTVAGRNGDPADVARIAGQHRQGWLVMPLRVDTAGARIVGK